MNESAILAVLADVLGVEAMQPEQRLDAQAEPWDSLAVVSALSLLDEQTGVLVDGERLSACTTAADVIALVGGGA